MALMEFLPTGISAKYCNRAIMDVIIQEFTFLINRFRLH